MDWHKWIGLTVVASITGGGCAGQPKTGDLDDSVYRQAALADRAKPAPVNQPAGGGGATAAVATHREMPVPPADARLTIYCQSYGGPGHQDRARQVRDLLMDNTALHKWYLVDENDQTKLYYGFYRTAGRDSADPAEGERAVADLNAIRTLHDSRNNRLFGTSLPVPIASPDPAANPAWDVARSGAYWSIEVGVFKDSADRKERAVEAVALLRQHGEPAYYYHGGHASSVCIGAWPKGAATELTTADQNVDPNAQLVVSAAPLPAAMQAEIKGGAGANVQVVAPHVEPTDPSLIAALRSHPDHFVNGYQMMKRGEDGRATGTAIEHAFLFRIPAADAGSDGTDVSPGELPITAPTPRPKSAGGQLRSLGDE